MNKKTLFTNIAYIAFGLVLAAGLSLAHAAFSGPTSAAPGNNIDVPLHTGPSQVKDGGLSVDTFIANNNAQFNQELFLNGTVYAGTPPAANTPATISIGDGANQTNVVVSGGVSAAGNIQAGTVKSGALCASANGTIIICP